MRIKYLGLSGCVNLTSIETLRGMPLEYLRLGAARVADLSPLRGMQIVELMLTDSSVTDLGPLAEMPLVKLHLGGCVMLKDVKALATCKDPSEVDPPLELIRHPCESCPISNGSATARMLSFGPPKPPPNSGPNTMLPALPKEGRRRKSWKSLWEEKPPRPLTVRWNSICRTRNCTTSPR